MEQKPKIANLNNFITSDTGRLTSLSLKRDLSLGGNKPKKVYKPNLNVVRNKNKPKTQVNSKILQHNKRNSRTFSPRVNHRHYQSTSVFSEGTGEFRRQKIHSDRHVYNGDRDQSFVNMPKIIRTKWEINTEDERTVIDELLADDAGNSSSDNEAEYNPVVLPLKDNKAGFMTIFGMKKEELDDIEIKLEIPQFKSCYYNNYHPEFNIETSLAFQNNKFYTEDHPCISLLRMPDSLPGKGFIKDSDTVTDFDLNQMIEGKIGKVLVRKSGIIEVRIGKITYILDSIESNPFREDLMSISTDEKCSRRGLDMINLGQVEEKYILSPSWKNIFDSRDVKKK